MANKLNSQQVKDLIKLEDIIDSGEAHYCDISGGDLYHILTINTFEDEYDIEPEELETFLSETDIGELDLAGIEVVWCGNEERGETETYSLIDFVTGYYDLNLYRLQNVEWKE